MTVAVVVGTVLVVLTVRGLYRIGADVLSVVTDRPSSAPLSS